MKWIFLTAPGGGGTAGTLDGLETARMVPSDDGNQAYFGIGDWFTTGMDVDPTERLDLLDGRARIRVLPDLAGEADAAYKIMVVDDTPFPSAERGVVKWVDPSAILGCEWTVQPDDDLATAYDPSAPSGCPAKENYVGIGTNDPRAKFDVLKSDNSELSPNPYDAALFQNAIGDLCQASRSWARCAGGTSIGARMMGENSGRNWGTVSEARGGGAAVGVLGLADGLSSAQPVGVWGVALNPPGGGINWGGFFDGYGFLGIGPWIYSDSSLKQNIADIQQEDALSRFMQLEPKSFEFNTSAHPSWGLPEGTQNGFLAQDLEEVYPHLVVDAIHPARIDSVGEVIEPEAGFKAMNMEGLIPEIVAVVKSQQQTIEAQNARISALEEVVHACCAASDGTRSAANSAGTGVGLETDLRIIPNPVAERTDLRYTLAHAGRVRLEVTDQMGRVVLTQDEGEREASAYAYQWDTTALAPGTYHCELYVNGEQLVRKAVKLNTR
ncbi:MAG: tail fiber domain-containing protein [Flavobacteriales bacterium]|nr:tail fiber domain-containing protein [Flavobacteriales bacterium]